MADAVIDNAEGIVTGWLGLQARDTQRLEPAPLTECERAALSIRPDDGNNPCDHAESG